MAGTSIDELRRAVVLDISGGMTASEASKKHGVAYKRALEWARAAGIELRQGPSRDEPKVAIAMAILRAGGTVNAAAASAGVSGTTVRVWARREAVPVVAAGLERERQKMIVFERVRAGERAAVAGEAAGVCAATVHKWCHEEGVHFVGASYTEAERGAAVDRVRRGETVLQVARDLAVSPAVVWRWCRAAGLVLDRRPVAQRRVEEQLPLILEKLESGATLRSIKEDTGVHESTLGRIAKRHGITTGPDLKHPIVLCDLDQVARRLEEILATGGRAERTNNERPSAIRTYQRWCKDKKKEPVSFDSVADFARHQITKGRSNRVGVRGRTTGNNGWTIATLTAALRVIDEWLEGQGHPGCRNDDGVKAAIDEAKRSAPAGGRGRRRLQDQELTQIAGVPLPRAPYRVLRLRLAAHVAGALRGPVRPAIGRASRVKAADVCLHAGGVTLTLAAAPGAEAAQVCLVHRPGGEVGCGHCVVARLLELRPDDVLLAGPDHTKVHEQWRAAVGRGGYASDVLPDGDDFDRLLWHCDAALVRAVSQRTIQALLISMKARVSEVIGLDLDGFGFDDEGRWEIVTSRRKNDQKGFGKVTPLDDDTTPETLRLLKAWLWLRGPATVDPATGRQRGPLFPGRGTLHMHRTTVQDNLLEQAEAAGVDTHRLGTHSIRRTAISTLLERRVDIFRVARVVGITPETAYYYWESIPFAFNVSENLGLAEAP